ncbi:ATP-dependent DNA ligase [Candidatus Woesearchaeota archaeon]|nr:ATP-dependent DNA ligase [Candidatus Woesearchaeota archaeon]
MDYSDLVNYYEKIGKTSKRLEKTEIISELLKNSSKEEISILIHLLQGKVFPNYDERKIGFSSRLMLKGISSAIGISQEEVEKIWKKEGDLGKVSEILSQKKKQKTLFAQKLTIKKVYSNIQKLAELEGEGTVSRKIALVSELLSNSSPLEAKYITRTVLEELRVGIAEGILRDSIAKAFNFEIKDIENLSNSLADYGEVAELAKQGKLKSSGLIVGRPNKVMLAIKVKDFKEAFEALGEEIQLEYKLDGFRVTIHKINNTYKFFTRRFEDVTTQFQEIILYLDKYIKGKSYILDSEFVGYNPKTKLYLPFQNISQRIRRKYDLQETAKKFPVEVSVFDILNYEGEDLIQKPLKERRKILEKIIKQEKTKVILTNCIITNKISEAEAFYKKALKEGLEGVMAKNINSQYTPGRYVNGWLKLKPIMETLDLVIVGAAWGEGKRSDWLSSFELACKNKNEFALIGKVGTGFKEKEGLTFEKLTKLLKPLIIKETGKIISVKPKIIVEVMYEEIQTSSTYSSGFALRFPRFLRLRNDKGLNGVSDIEYIKKLFKSQK